MSATKTKTAIFTSCAVNYIPKARLLAGSVREFVPQANFWLLACDEIPDSFDASKEPFDFIKRASELEIKNFRQWIFGHQIVEACTAVKPFMLRWLLAQGYERVIYFDPDVVLFHGIEVIEDGFNAGGSILLTPHICEPEKSHEAIKDNELNSLKHGLYNLGFVAVKNDRIGKKYADWWAERCYSWCIADIAAGIFTDQKWNDHVPVFFDDVTILKHPGLNVATWNYAQRKLEGSLKNGITVNGEPFIFHHFTGFDSGAHYLMRDKYGRDMPAALELSEWYTKNCQSHADEALEAVRWAYGFYDNGQKIQHSHRKLYRNRTDLHDAYPDPFSLQPQGSYRNSYYRWLSSHRMLDDVPLADEGKPFGQFLRETQAQLMHYVRATARLPGWVKTPLSKGLALGFCGVRFAASWLESHRKAS